MKKWNEKPFPKQRVRFLVQIVWKGMIEGIKIMDILSHQPLFRVRTFHSIQMNTDCLSDLGNPNEMKSCDIIIVLEEDHACNAKTMRMYRSLNLSGSKPHVFWKEYPISYYLRF